MQIQKLFVDVFNPKKLEDYILPKRIKGQFKSGIYGHILMHGSPGTGKSSLAKFLSQNHAYAYYNISSEGRIDVLRGEINEFCVNAQINMSGEATDIKVVILDEIDGASSSFYEALRGFMDQYGKKTRFLATCNLLSKVPLPIQSRFDLIDFDPTSTDEEKEVYDGYYRRMKAVIIKALKLEVEEEAMKLLVDKNFPDFRGILQDIQRLNISGNQKITVSDVKTKTYEFIELYELILSGTGKPEDIHSLLMGEYSNKVQDVLISLDSKFVDYIIQNKNSFMWMIPYIIVEVAKYQAMLYQVIDPAICMKACVFSLMQIATKKTK